MWIESLTSSPLFVITGLGALVLGLSRSTTESDISLASTVSSVSSDSLTHAPSAASCPWKIGHPLWAVCYLYFQVLCSGPLQSRVGHRADQSYNAASLSADADADVDAIQLEPSASETNQPLMSF